MHTLAMLDLYINILWHPIFEILMWSMWCICPGNNFIDAFSIGKASYTRSKGETNTFQCKNKHAIWVASDPGGDY